MKNPTTLSRMSSPLAIPFLRNPQKMKKKKGKSKCVINCMELLRSEMDEISEDQKQIKEGQRQVREKFEAIESECDQLRKETNEIMQQSFSTQIRLAFMFQILKARENQDFDTAARLTAALRELIARDQNRKN